MKMLALAFALIVMAAFNSVSAAAEDNQKLLIGKWETTKADEGSLPLGTTVEFTKDGKLKLVIKKEGKDVELDGTYTVQGEGFTYNMKFGDENITSKVTINKISDNELSTTNDKGKSATFKRVK